MEDINRKPFQGVLNIIQFNWHFYMSALILIIILVLVQIFISVSIGFYLNIFLVLIMLSTLISLLVSMYVYDFSDLYKLEFLDNLTINNETKFVNINAGFDETSHLIKIKFPHNDLDVLDFYDSENHTEISIERARKKYAPFINTRKITTSRLDIVNCSIDYVILVLAAHEIRKMEERVVFFNEIRLVLKPTGKIIVIEHLRDVPNFLAYNIGFLHFISKSEWKQTFNLSKLLLKKEQKITPFISIFTLEKNGITS